MNMVQCNKGHFYNPEMYPDGCPHCKAESASMAGGDHTIPVNMVQSEPVIKTTPMNQTQSILSDDDKTVKVDINTESGEEFAVGWLICIKGNHVGHDFRLHSGRNFIGRGHDMDVRLDGDTSVSRASQAVVVYDPKSRSYLAQPGESRELFYVNGEVSLESKLLKAYDQLEIGNTTLLFLPLCNDIFDWSKVETDGEEAK